MTTRRRVACAFATALLTTTASLSLAAPAALAATSLSFGDLATVDTPTGPGSEERPMAVVTGDVNRDGLADVLVASTDQSIATSGVVSVYLSSRTGPPSTRTDYAVGAQANGIAVGLLNSSDSYLDVVTTTYGGVSIMLGNADGTFQAPEQRAATGYLKQPVIADLNGDGRKDIAAADYYHGSFIGGVTVMLNNDDGTFATSSIELGVNTFPGRLAVGDLNGDGRPDLVATNHVFHVLIGNGDGTFVAPVQYSWRYATYGNPDFPAELTDVGLADFNGDGRVDVAASESNDTSASLWFFPGNGDGTFDFASAVRRTSGTGAVMLSVADVDRDGGPDVVTGSEYGAYRPAVFSDRSASAWPDVSYSAYAPYSGESAPYATLAAADLSGDLYPDLITLDRTNRKLVLRKQSLPDTTKPTITLTTPASGATYNLNDAVTAAFTCTDNAGGSGLASCTGTVPNGSSVDTSSVGTRSFTVNAADVAGNTETRTVSYTVVSAASGTVDPSTGGTVANAPPTSSNPVGTAVTVPPGATGDTVSITSSSGVTTPTPTGYDLLGQQVLIEAPVATWDNPLALTFTLDSSLVGSTDPSTIGVVRNGVVLADCPAGSTTAIAPTNPADPNDLGTACISSRLTVGGGDLQFTVLTPHASTWNFSLRRDVTAPAITLTTPGSNASYVLGSTVNASYACVEETGGSGVASCTGTVASGRPINTATIGTKSFVVTATDNAGNTRTRSVTYSVIYNWRGFLAPVANPSTINVVAAGRGVPLSFGLGGNQGLGVLAGPPATTAIACPSGASNTITQTVTGDSSLKYSSKPDKYEYAWPTNKAWAGSCRSMTLTLNDGTNHVALFRFK